MSECKECGHDLPAGFCHACCRDFPPEKMSEDPRYCHYCFNFLHEGAKLLPSKKKPGWVPIIIKCAKSTQKQHTLRDVPVTVFAHPDDGQDKSSGGLTGRPTMTLPVEMIQNLYGQGAGVNEIMRQLKEKGYSPSKRTVYNVLAGQRVMV